MEQSAAEVALRGLIEMNRAGDKLREQFIREHRTHQQMIGGTVFRLIAEMGSLYEDESQRSRYFDGRNEHFGKICSEIKNFMEEQRHGMWYKMPLI